MPADIVRERLDALVAWEWQDVEDLMEKLIPVVPPGRAKRQYETTLGSYRRNNPHAEPIPSRQLTDDEKIASGARSVVNARISAMAETGKLEIDREGDRRRVRLRVRTEVADAQGRCPTCNQHFPPATTKLPQSSPRKPRQQRPSTVITPNVPQWLKQETA